MTEAAIRLDERRMMDKQKALDSALAQIERSFGKGSIMKLGQSGAVQDIEAVSTGSLGLDSQLCGADCATPGAARDWGCHL